MTDRFSKFSFIEDQLEVLEKCKDFILNLNTRIKIEMCVDANITGYNWISHGVTAEL